MAKAAVCRGREGSRQESRQKAQRTQAYKKNGGERTLECKMRGEVKLRGCSVKRHGNGENMRNAGVKVQEREIEG